jgi:glucan endo-1,3-alpha-glucosidase
VYLGDAAAYVDSFPHDKLRIIAQYYISWFKTGSAPSVTVGRSSAMLIHADPLLQSDQVIMWYREYPKNATCATGNVPRNSQYPADAVFAYALLSYPATITLDIGSNNHFQWDAPAGASMGQVPFPHEDNQIPYIQVVRDDAVAKSGYGSLYVTKECNGIYNFNFFVGAI